MKVFNKIFLCIFLLLGINLYSQSNSNYKKGVSNILNAQNPDDIGIRSASQIQEDKDDPLEYGYVNDKDILWSTTVWEIIDLDQRVNYPLLYPIDTNVVGKERRPMLWWLRQEIEKFNIPVYDPGFDEGEFLEKVPNEDIENIFQIKINTEKGDQRLEDVVYELEEQITSQVEKYGFNPYEEEISAEQKQVLDSDTTFVKMFPYEIKDYSSYKLLSSRDFSYEQFLGFTSPDGAVRFMQPDGIADLLSPEEVVEYNAALEELLSELFFEENDDFYYKNLELEDLKQWLIKGIWYFDKKQSQLKYRLLGIQPVSASINALKDEVPDPELTSTVFWIWYPSIRKELNQNLVFNDRNNNNRISFDALLVNRRFSSYIYKYDNVYGDRTIRDYIRQRNGESNRQYQLRLIMESERIKKEILDFDVDMWGY